MLKVRILDRCEFCDGEAYIFDSQDADSRGETYDRYRSCEMCIGTENSVKKHRLSPLRYRRMMIGDFHHNNISLRKQQLTISE
jgi:hypothetical protein